MHVSVGVLFCRVYVEVLRRAERDSRPRSTTKRTRQFDKLAESSPERTRFIVRICMAYPACAPSQLNAGHYGPLVFFRDVTQ
jgi:hypothetical protein